MTAVDSPVYASLVDPLPQAGKRVFSFLFKLHPLSAKGEERVDKRSEVGVTRRVQSKSEYLPTPLCNLHP
jgi:hypothetical protein